MREAMPAEMESAERHLAALYGISKALASYGGAAESFPELFKSATAAVPIDIMVLVERGETLARTCVEKREGVSTERVEAAVANARTSLDYYTTDHAVPVTVESPASRVPPIALPLTVGGFVLGILYVETSRLPGEVELAFIDALTNQLAIAIRRHDAWLTAKESILSRDNMLSVVSHDLRNMLTSILLTTQLAAEMTPGPEREAFNEKGLGLIRRSALRMNHLLEDLLDTASIDASRISVSCEPQPIAPLVQEAVELFQAQADTKGVHFSGDVAPDLGAVHVDRDRILQVLGNLLGNAIKFTPRGGTIGIRAEPLANEVLLSVSDTGSGISEDQQPHIFDRFWQAARIAKMGTGLGLAIAKGIVEALGGRIWLTSKKGEGTTFYFTVPLARRDSERARMIARSSDLLSPGELASH